MHMTCTTKLVSACRKIACLLLIYLLTCSNAIAANKVLDSLLASLREKAFDDTTRVLVLGHIAGEYDNVNVDSMISYGNKGIALAEQLHFDKGKAYCQFKLGLAYLHINDNEKALSNFESALNYYIAKGTLKPQANIFLCMADIFYRQAKFDKAIEYYKKGINIYDQIKYPEGKGFAYVSIGGVYNDLGSYQESINNYLLALKAFDEDNHTPGIVMTLSNIASLYATLGNFPKALDYIQQCETIKDTVSTLEERLHNISNIGNAYGVMKNYKKSLTYFIKAYDLSVSMRDDLWKNVCLVNIGDSYYGMNEYDTAMIKYVESIKQNRLNNAQVTVGANQGIGRILIKQNKVNDGIKYLLTSMKAAKENSMKQQIFENARELSEAYEQVHNLAEALAYHKIYYNYKDSVNGDKEKMEIQQVQFDYDLNKKESQISLLKKDKIIEQSRNKFQLFIMWASLSGVALLIAISIILYRSNQQEKKNKERILKQKEEIELQASKLQELNKFKDKTFSVLSHDLRGPLQAFTSIVELFDQNEITAEEFNEMKPEVSRQLNSMNILLDNLLNWAKIYMQGQRAAKYVTTNLHDIIVENIDLLHGMADNKHIRIMNNVPATAKAICDQGEINIVIRNLVMNAIKFTGANGTILISSTVHDHHIKVSVADTGVGMTEEQLSKLFTTSPDNTTYGTEGEKGTGLGLLLCYEFVKANNGSIYAESKAGEGTTITISLILA
ncbi:MAG: tetratricopeptide repeat protein [Flavipsychrobacter sp.]|nr:tetratricopeptide repeat protein [Flavipsychrobacter sp.]